jgi:hypothetical protein
MNTLTALATGRRRRYDDPAQLSDQAAAEELKQLTKATLALTRRIFGHGDVVHGDAETQKSLKAASRNIGEVVRILTPRSARSSKDVKSLAANSQAYKRTGTRARGEAGTDSAVADHVAALVKRGILTDSAQLCARLGWTRQSLSKALKAQRIFFIEQEGVRLYPAFFSDHRFQRGHLEAVSKAMGALPGGAKLQFFLSQRGSLGGTSVLDALARGEKDKVVAAARAFAEG